ncbi:uncharacterized protein EAE98_007838 [Botrytis deweyae]|uniref:Uncharacterized protein n=2 Tax=Botrytis TaxID=33196 RepID=A0A4Z1JLA4_9HELO|nr:uncharacterized protein EAE98_007838 [Botrytis deweyae]KAF7923133.1 hypothetical protein EAE98_007838 [Botrytis deweyae]KAF7936823.1 hypothetical protein EAE99_002172 [Botrytis elliptica]TGO72270.1 hypothetical protein BELL_0473g00080 [Botrytis elliptica]
MKALWWVAIALALRSLLGSSHGSSRDQGRHESRGRRYDSRRRRERTRSNERYEYDGDARDFERLSGLGETLLDLLGTETKSKKRTERKRGSRSGEGQEGRSRRGSFAY